jgi:hypothetical protein
MKVTTCWNIAVPRKCAIPAPKRTRCTAFHSGIAFSSGLGRILQMVEGMTGKLLMERSRAEKTPAG